jgi:hypothetical protein
MKSDGCAGAANGCHLFASKLLLRFTQPMVNGPLRSVALSNGGAQSAVTIVQICFGTFVRTFLAAR